MFFPFFSGNSNVYIAVTQFLFFSIKYRQFTIQISRRLNVTLVIAIFVWNARNQQIRVLFGYFGRFLIEQGVAILNSYRKRTGFPRETFPMVDRLRTAETYKKYRCMSIKI